MPRVDFYVLEAPHGDGLLRQACRLAEKAWQMGHRVFILTPSAEATRQVDELLWVFRPDSFVPHGLYSDPDNEDLPVRIGHDSQPAAGAEVLVNLTPAVPEFHGSFERVAEFVAGDEESRHLGRERFRYYRDRGYDVRSHQV